MGVDQTTTSERILEATVSVLARTGQRRLSMSDVAAEAGVSRPTLYKWFPSKEQLLEAFGRHEQHKYDSGIAAAIEGLDGDARLDAVLRFIVDFQHTYQLRQMVEAEPEHWLHQMRRVLPIMRNRLVAQLPGPNQATTASILTRIALSHALVPDDDPSLFLLELRTAAGLGYLARRAPHRTSRPRRTTR